MSGASRSRAPLVLRLYRAYKQLTSPNPFLVRGFLARTPRWVGDESRIDLCVDVGAGVAPYEGSVVKHLGPRRYLALDLAPSDRTGVVADACRLPLTDGAADLVVSFEAIQHIPDSACALDEMCRLLPAGGHLLISFPFVYGECDVRDHRRWTILGMCEELRLRGLTVVAAEPRAGVLFAVAHTLSWMVHHLVPGGRCGWRAERNLAGVAREAVVALLTLPTQLLEWIALAIDRFLPEPAYYTGGIVLARADLTPSESPSRRKCAP